MNRLPEVVDRGRLHADASGHRAGTSWTTALAVLGLFLTMCANSLPARAASGQDDLDSATVKQVQARTMEDLEEVIQLCESALQKGLSKDNERIARQLLSSTLYQHASRTGRAIFEGRVPPAQWPEYRRYALNNLEKALRHDEKLGACHVLIARLEMLPGGDRENAQRAASKAVELSGDDGEQLSAALVLRGSLIEDADQRLADFDRAIESNPRNVDAWRARGLAHLLRGDDDKALNDFNKLLEIDAGDIGGLQALAELLARKKQFDQAVARLGQAIERFPESHVPYLLRARVWLLQDEPDKALEDLNKAVNIDPQNLAALLLRARVRQGRQHWDAAHADIQRALQLQPGLPQAILLRSMLYAAQGRHGDAIADVRQLLRANPDSRELQIQLAVYHVGDSRPRKAIEIYSALIEADPQDWISLRGRADALLSTGDQVAALEDYEAALKLQPDDSGVMNNLAWVLATSPDAKLRDGQRSLELARKASELTEHKQAHILSTLAAACAETGDFDSARNWSRKALALGDGELKEQLTAELRSYEQQKPWRELQDVPERPDQAPPKDSDLDAE